MMRLRHVRPRLLLTKAPRPLSRLENTVSPSVSPDAGSRALISPDCVGVSAPIDGGRV
jgi:hypothetical protein